VALLYRNDKRLAAVLRYAKLRHQAAVEDVDYRTPRGRDRGLFRKLVAGDWIDEHDNLVICGPTGIGKSWLACALGHKACRDNRSVLYQRVPRSSSPNWRSPEAMVITRGFSGRLREPIFSSSTTGVLNRRSGLLQKTTATEPATGVTP